MNDFVFKSELPDDHPQGILVERSVRRALGRRTGRWQVWVRRARAAACWGFLEVHGPGLPRLVLIVDDPADVESQLLAHLPSPATAAHP